MAQVHAVPDADRLPWLTDEKPPARAGRTGLLLPGALAAAMLVAAGSYWLGSTSAVQAPSPVETAELRGIDPVERIQPQPAPVQPRSQHVEPVPMPEVQPAPEPSPVVIRMQEAVEIAEPVPVTIPEGEAVSEASAAEGGATAAAPGSADTSAALQTVGETAAAPAVPPQAQPVVRMPLRPWPAAQSAGAAGRMVRIGTFASRYQAKRAWWRVIRTYPGLRRLKAVVVPVASMRNGRTYYRLQFGTTSHAHSVVLCQRMRIVGQSCVPVGVTADQSPA